MKKLSIKRGFWLLLSALIFIPIVIFFTQSAQAITVRAWIHKYEIVFILWRLSLLATIFVAWPFWIRHYAKKYEWEPHYEKQMIEKRWSLAFWLILIDLVMVENILAHLF